MAINRSQLARDLSAKLRLEKRLRPKIRVIENDLVRALIKSIGGGRGVPNVKGASHAKLEPVLLAHYLKVVKQFSDTVRGQLPKAAAITPEEAKLVEEAVRKYSEDRAPEQAKIIASTNDDDARESATIAKQEIQRLIAGGERSVGDRDEAVIAGAVFQRKLRGRTDSIATVETQASAEAAKQAEAGVLVRPGIHASKKAAAALKRVVKEWVTQGDSRVRNHHLKVDSGQVPVSEPYVVNGEKLMHPGDTSLGASPNNIVNCRCSSVTDVAAVASARLT